jgi:dethiobiotin synthetase
MKHKLFIAGTDTDVGKTLVAAAILEYANQRDLTTVALKPVAAGCEKVGQELRNGDALLLQKYASMELSYEQVNPFAFAPAIAPHIAAQDEGRRLSADRIVGFCRGVMMQGADLTVVEGAGGWRVPLNDREYFSRIPQLLKLPVVLVVGMRLGCINHALLTAEAIQRDGLTLVGWVANCIDPDMARYQDNLMTLKNAMSAPLLGEIPFMETPTVEFAAQKLRLTFLLQ